MSDNDGIGKAVAAQERDTVDLTKPLQTRAGSKAVFLGEDKHGKTFAIGENGTWDIQEVEHSFMVNDTGIPHRNDIINTPVTHKLTGVFQIYSDGAYHYTPVGRIIPPSNSKTLAVIDFADHNITFDEGEGLDQA